jgi:hypothetical protein
MPRKGLNPKVFWKREAKATCALFLENPSKVTLSVAVIDCCRYLFAVQQEKYPLISQRLDIESFVKAISYVINSFE